MLSGLIRKFRNQYLPSWDEHPLYNDIQWERHRLFMAEVGSRMVGSVVVATVIGLMFLSSATAMHLAIWFSGIGFVAINSWFLIRLHYREEESRSVDKTLTYVRRWHWINLYLSVIWGIFWSLTPFLFFPDASPIQIMSLLLLIVVMSSMPSVTMGCYPDIYITFLTPVFFSFSWQLLSVDFGGEILPLVISPLTWVLLVVFSILIHRTHMEAIVLRLEHQRGERKASQKTEAKTRFIAVASHDLRQPVQAARLYAESMLTQPELRNQTTVEKLTRSLVSASDLLDRLLDISRMDAGVLPIDVQNVRLYELINQLAAVHAAHAQEKAIELIVENSDISAQCDKGIVTEILDNIISNAIRYTDEGSVTLSVKQQGTEVVIRVADTGRGIPDEMLPSVFEEFVQLEDADGDTAKGMGLGLPIVKRLCQLHKLSFELSSQENKGTVFTLRMPCTEQADSQPDVAPKQELIRPLRILLVDDEVQITDALSSVLVAEGHDVWACNSFAEVEAVLISGRFNAEFLITDDRLPDGKNSADVIKCVELHQLKPLPTLILSGNTTPERIQEFEGSGIEVLFKPVGRSALLSAMLNAFSTQ